MVSSVVSPTFKWIANGDPTAGYPHNLFALIVAKNDFKTIVGIKANIRATEYTFTDAEWAGITVQADRTGRFQWAVAARNTTVFSLPGAGQIPFVSNPRGFRLRAYHLRLTWTTFGADVDLHFIPPNGATCSFRNRSPDWGVAGDPSDNPTLDRDCITSCTEENITVDKLTAPGTYRVAVHYYYDHDRGGTTATVEILQYGYRVAAIQRYLGRTGAYSTVFNVTVSAAGDCVFEESGDAPLEGVTVAPGFQKAEPADD